MTVAFATIVDVSCVWKSRPTAIVHVLGHHRAVKGEERGVAAAANAADDRVAHVLVRTPFDVAGRMSAGGERHDDLRTHPLRGVEEAADLRVGVLELGDRGVAAQRAERLERGGDGRERVRLVHHRGDYELPAWHQTTPLSRSASISAAEYPISPRIAYVCSPSIGARCRKRPGVSERSTGVGASGTRRATHG